eukprot:m.45460 g.45460  ORF g.45460 m.45460 type:complete len:733 (+) comp7223_c0_seq1:146-2344(+)
MSVVESVQLERDCSLLEKRLKQKYVEPTLDEKVRDPNATPSSPFYHLLQNFRKCNSLRNSLRASLEAQTIQASKTRTEYTNIVNTFAESVQTAVSKEKASSIQDLVVLKEECNQLRPLINKALKEEEDLRSESEKLRIDIANTQTESNKESTNLNDGIAQRTALLSEINNTRIEKEQVNYETETILKQIRDLTHEIKHDKEMAQTHEKEMTELERDTMLQFAHLKQEHDDRDRALMELLENLKSSKQELMEENSLLRQRIKPLEAARDHALATSTSIREEIKNLQQSIVECDEKLQQERDAIQQREEEHETIMRRTVESIQYCNSEAKRFENEADEKSGSTSSISKECKQLDRDRIKHERVLDGLVARAQEAREEMEWKSAEVHQLTIKIATLEEEMKKKRTEISISITGHKAKYNKLMVIYNHTKSERIRMEGELEHDQYTLNDETKAYQETLHTLKASVEKHKMESEVLTTLIVQNTQHVQSSQNTITHFKDNIPKLEDLEAVRHATSVNKCNKLTKSIQENKKKARDLDEKDRTTQKLLSDLGNDLKEKHEDYLKQRAEIDHQNSLLSTRNQAYLVVIAEKERLLIPNQEARKKMNETISTLNHKKNTYATEINTLDYRLGLIKRRQHEYTMHQTKLEDAIKDKEKDNDYVRRSTTESEENTQKLILALQQKPKQHLREEIGMLPVTVETNEGIQTLLLSLENHSNNLGNVAKSLEQTLEHSSMDLILG